MIKKGMKNKFKVKEEQLNWWIEKTANFCLATLHPKKFKGVHFCLFFFFKFTVVKVRYSKQTSKYIYDSLN